MPNGVVYENVEKKSVWKLESLYKGVDSLTPSGGWRRQWKGVKLSSLYASLPDLNSLQIRPRKKKTHFMSEEIPKSGQLVGTIFLIFFF